MATISFIRFDEKDQKLTPLVADDYVITLDSEDLETIIIGGVPTAVPKVKIKKVSEVFSTKTTYLYITGSKASGVTYDVTASGVNYTLVGVAADLGASSAIFNTSRVRVLIDGVDLEKGVDVVWASSGSLVFNGIVDNGDKIKIIS